MKTGTIVLIPFPFAELSHVKVRPALVVTTTKDKDLILCANSSVMPDKVNSFEMIIKPHKYNLLRIHSIVKIDRIVTLKKEDVIARLGMLLPADVILFRKNSGYLLIRAGSESGKGC